MRVYEDCKDCDGTGDDHQGFPCLSCNGTGQVEVTPPTKSDWLDVAADLLYHGMREEQ